MFVITVISVDYAF